MGSWYETCALTRLPIKEKDPVVIYRAYTMDAYESPYENGDVPLLMGFHSFGEYNDCSTYTFQNDASTMHNRQLIDYAERHNNVWRAVDAVDHRNGATRVFVAKDARQLDRHICMSFSALASSNDDYHTWTKGMREKAQVWLNAVHDRINTELPVSTQDLSTILQDETVRIFQEHASAWKLLLESNHLWIGRAYELPIHRAAFESMCSSIDQHDCATSKKMMNRFERWKMYDDEEQALRVTNPGLKMGVGEMRCGDNLWKPLTSPLRISSTPLHSNFWDAVEPSTILNRIGLDHAMQSNLFTYALMHTRASLTRGITGSQNENMMLLANAVGAVAQRQLQQSLDNDSHPTLG
jgi:hypothetical protein